MRVPAFVRAALAVACLVCRPIGAAGQGTAPVVVEGVLLSDTYASHPLAGLPLAFVDSATARLVPVVLGADGTARVDLAPGRYRLVSQRPHAWRGETFEWDVPVTVQGRTLVQLTERNARVSGVPARVVAAAPVGPVKDPGTAAVLSFVLTGAGQMYAGKTGKGLALLGVQVGALVAGAAASSCDTFGRGPVTCDYTPLFVGAGVSVGTWLLSVIEAGGDAREWNARHAVASRDVTPLLLAGRGPATLGLAIRW